MEERGRQQLLVAELEGRLKEAAAELAELQRERAAEREAAAAGPAAMSAEAVQAALVAMDRAMLSMGEALRKKQVEVAALEATVQAERQEKARMMASMR